MEEENGRRRKKERKGKETGKRREGNLPRSLTKAADDGMVGVYAVYIVLAHNNILWGKGAVHKAMLMQVGEATQNLGEHVLNLNFNEEEEEEEEERKKERKKEAIV